VFGSRLSGDGVCEHVRGDALLEALHDKVVVVLEFEGAPTISDHPQEELAPEGVSVGPVQVWSVTMSRPRTWPITHERSEEAVCSALNTQVLSGAVARRTGIIVGTGSLSRKSRTIRLTNEGFSMK
jgi:hypothetical protein